MKHYLTFSEKETKDLGKKLASKLHGVIALSGPLGAGKTTFVQGFAKGLGIKEKIISPTFVLIRQHKIPNSKKMLFHIDLYRLENEKQLKGLGLEEIRNDSNHISLIEWAEKAKDFLPKSTSYINFEALDETKRKITVTSSLS
ncbi:MAG: tRNA (adenosine(37)-N6)-threonylcarbamoyltransferase complex ATPase subunit type 1 TsaE [Patescibacteria group bacterium]